MQAHTWPLNTKFTVHTLQPFHRSAPIFFLTSIISRDITKNMGTSIPREVFLGGWQVCMQNSVHPREHACHGAVIDAHATLGQIHYNFRPLVMNYFGLGGPMFG